MASPRRLVWLKEKDYQITPNNSKSRDIYSLEYRNNYRQSGLLRYRSAPAAQVATTALEIVRLSAY